MSARTEPSELRAPRFTDVLEARRRIRPHLDPTPLRQQPGLSALTGAERDQLAKLLLKIADQQGLVRGVHPGYRGPAGAS